MQGICHRGIKADSLQVIARDSEKIFVALAGFGFAERFEGHNQLSKAIGTRLYMAPEIVRNEPYGEKIDVWAIGVLAFFLST